VTSPGAAWLSPLWAFLFPAYPAVPLRPARPRACHAESHSARASLNLLAVSARQSLRIAEPPWVRQSSSLAISDSSVVWIEEYVLSSESRRANFSLRCVAMVLIRLFSLSIFFWMLSEMVL